MAKSEKKTENKGYYPYDALIRYQKDFPEKASKKSSQVLNVLNNRMHRMVYKDSKKASTVRLIEDMFLSTEDLGLEVAEALRLMIPECRFSYSGKEIRLHDIPHLDNAKIRQFDKEHTYLDVPDKLTLQDSQFLVILYNDEFTVDMYIGLKWQS